jgi:outer membrane protein assembly factor BamB
VAALSVGVAGCRETTQPPDEPFDRPTDRWPSAGYAPGATGHAPAGPGPSPPTERWRTARRATDPGLFGVLGTPVVGEHVYVAGLVGRFWPDDRAATLAALTRDDGEPVWAVGIGPGEVGGLTGGPAVLGDAVLVGGRDGRLHARRVEDGTPLWELGLGGPVGTPVPYGDRAYVTDGQGGLHAVADGERLWRVRRGDLVGRWLGDGRPVEHAGPAADGRGVYAAFEPSDGPRAALVAYDHGGEQRWTYRTDRGAGELGGVAVADDRVYLSAGGAVHAVDAATGERRWRFATGYRGAGAPATDGERVYVGAKNCYALGTEGEERWRLVNEAVEVRGGWRDGLPYLARPAVADGRVYLRRGAVDAATGERLWGDDADGWLDEDTYAGPYGTLPVARPAVTADGLYLTHANAGVQRFA